MNWIIENQTWLFSGVAIAVPIAIIGWFISAWGNKQTQKGGKNSTNVQVGGDINVGIGKNRE